ncbi:MAG: M48 family metallopeptidase [Candidatus Acidiferrales bacterium]
MKRLPLILAACVFALGRPVSLPAKPAPLSALQSAQQQATTSLTPTIPAPAAAQKRVTEYTLPPDLYKKAHNLGKIAFWGQLGGVLYTVIVLLFFLNWNLASKYRDWAERVSSSRFVQLFIFVPAFVFSFRIFLLPLDILRHWVGRKFGLVIQGWGSWAADWAKGQGVSIIIAIIAVGILFAVIRSSPRRWWFYFWLASIPLTLCLIFLQPLVVDPLFHKFEPLAQKDAPLTASLEQMVQRSGEAIPPERMFWMGAGEKLNAINAYVTGLGPSKRIVVWDTTIAKMTTPQIVYVAGHEMGHYVLNHIWKGIAFLTAVLFIAFFLGFRSMDAILLERGARWGIRGVDDWAALPLFIFLLTIFFFFTSPVESAFSRHLERQADQYGLEVTRGLTADSSQIAAQSFQILGEIDLDDPNPNPVSVLLFYSHPPIRDRVRFSLTYDPWLGSGRGEFVK